MGEGEGFLGDGVGGDCVEGIGDEGVGDEVLEELVFICLRSKSRKKTYRDEGGFLD